MNLEVTGAKVLFNIPVFGGIPITETIVNTWIVMALIVGLCIFLTHGMQVHARTKRQVVAEYLVGMVRNMVKNNMGERFMQYVPFIGALFSLAMLSSLISMVGMFSPTGDLSTCVGWALLVFVVITYYKIRTQHIGGYLKGFTQPVFIMTPLNMISEVATPISMAFRLFGNIASGSVVTLLLYGGLAALSSGILGLIPGAVGEVLSLIPIFQLGIPAILSIYFDLFTSVLQAFIFCMLTMMYIKLACEE
ncbi:MAG: F0F1 ATP synthase subunit A [Aristaeellaceae bacterium]